MALALNAKSDAPVEVTELLKARERERENKRRRKKGIAEEVGEGKKRRRDDNEVDDAAMAHSDNAAGSAVEKGKKRVRTDQEGDVDAVTDPEASAAAGAADKPKKPKKRTKAERKALAKARDAEVTTVGPSAAPDADLAVPRKGGALDALKDDGSAAPRPVSAPAAAPPPPPAEARPEEKQKTSVAKIIEVRKPDGGKKKGKKSKAAADSERAAVDVGALLGLAPDPTESASLGDSTATIDGPATAATAKEDPLASLGSGSGNAWGAAGNGLFGGGGWD